MKFTVAEFMSTPCNHGNIRSICQWCQRDLADAKFVPAWAFEKKPRHADAIAAEQYRYRQELLRRAGLRVPNDAR